MEVLKLLQSQNRTFKKLVDCSRAFLASDWKGDLKALHEYESQRALIVRTLSLFEGRINSVVQSIPSSERTQVLISAVQNCMNEKNALYQEFINLDLKVEGLIRNEQERISKLVHHTEKNQDLLNRFKSTWVPESGESLDGMG